MAKVHLQRVTIRTPDLRNARRCWSHRETLLLTLRGEDSNLLGYGEASPLPGFSRETLDVVEACLHQVELTQLWQGAQPFDTPLVTEQLPAAARFCLESALLTAFCRERGLSLEQALCAAVSTNAPTQEAANPGLASVQSAALVDLFSGDAYAHALTAANAGTRVLKIKVGRDLDLEEQALSSMVRNLRSNGHEITLRLDANQTLSLSNVAVLARKWKHLPIDYLEEPCPTAELLATPPRPVDLPLALDESLAAGVAALRPWLDSGQVRALVCKPMYLGGIAVTLGFANVTRQYGIPAILSHLFDGPWAHRVYEALARVVSPGVVAGLAPHPALPAWRQALGDLAEVTLKSGSLL